MQFERGRAFESEHIFESLTSGGGCENTAKWRDATRSCEQERGVKADTLGRLLFH